MRSLGILLLLVAVSACDSSGPDHVDVVSFDVVYNPTGRSPLAAEARIQTSSPVTVEVIVEGKGGAGTEVRGWVSEPSADLSVPVLGLYPGQSTEVAFVLLASGIPVDTLTQSVEALPLRDNLPEIQIDAYDASRYVPGVNLVSYFGHSGDPRPQTAFAFDHTGAVRWVLDVAGDPELDRLFYDNGVERLANGNLYFGDGSSSTIYEVDMLGRTVNTWAMPGFGFHHTVLEKPDGNFIVTVNKGGAATVEDHLIEIDRQTGEIVTVWDLRESLDRSRDAWPNAFGGLDTDWFHANAVEYDPSDDTIIVSGRTQGVVKLTRDNRVVWILAPHRGWGLAGDGTDLATRLLQPLDAGRVPITDASVLDGARRHPEFEWSWYQHAPALMPDGSLLLFDNGDNRGYTGSQRYSRVVQYDIDEGARTIRQVWEYGRERGEETYSRIVSDVDYLAEADHVVFMPGAISVGGADYGKVVEVDRFTREVVFEATITPPEPVFIITYHRIERLPLYPETRWSSRWPS